MHCCIPTPTTDSNTSMGMIWVSLNMPSAGNHKGISRCLESGHPVHIILHWVHINMIGNQDKCN